MAIIVQSPSSYIYSYQQVRPVSKDIWEALFTYCNNSCYTCSCVSVSLLIQVTEDNSGSSCLNIAPIAQYFITSVSKPLSFCAVCSVMRKYKFQSPLHDRNRKSCSLPIQEKNMQISNFLFLRKGNLRNMKIKRDCQIISRNSLQL